MSTFSTLLNKMVWVNFVASVWLSIVGAALLLYDPSLILPEPLEAYGPLNNNVKYVIVYVGAAQLLLWALFYRKKRHREALLAGLFLLLIAFELPLYGNVNDIPVPFYLSLAAGYMGISHIIFASQGIDMGAGEPQEKR